MNFPHLAGNTELKRALDASMARGTLSHAYILSGPEGSGKRTLARLTAAALVCTGAASRPCMTCAHCVKAFRDIHPDIRTLDSGGKELVVGRIRDELRADAWVRPNEAERKVYIVVHAQDMNAFSQNALLSILEEPPDYAFFLLLAENADALLPTVRSRCVELSMQSVGARDALPVLKSMFPEIPETRLLDALSLSGGFIGRAAALLREGEPRFDEQAERYVKTLAEGGELALFEFCMGLEKLGREDFAAFLDALSLLIRGALIEKLDGAGGNGPCAAFGRAQLFSLAALAGKLRGYCDFNAGVAHLAGMLGCEGWEIRMSGERKEPSFD